jgi:hypothetical protein
MSSITKGKGSGMHGNIHTIFTVKEQDQANDIAYGPFSFFYYKLISDLIRELKNSNIDENSTIPRKIWNENIKNAIATTQTKFKKKGITKKSISESIYRPDQKAAYEKFARDIPRAKASEINEKIVNYGKTKSVIDENKKFMDSLFKRGDIGVDVKNIVQDIYQKSKPLSEIVGTTDENDNLILQLIEEDLSNKNPNLNPEPEPEKPKIRIKRTPQQNIHDQLIQFEDTDISPEAIRELVRKVTLDKNFKVTADEIMIAENIAKQKKSAEYVPISKSESGSESIPVISSSEGQGERLSPAQIRRLKKTNLFLKKGKKIIDKQQKLNKEREELEKQLQSIQVSESETEKNKETKIKGLKNKIEKVEEKNKQVNSDAAEVVKEVYKVTPISEGPVEALKKLEESIDKFEISLFDGLDELDKINARSDLFLKESQSFLSKQKSIPPPAPAPEPVSTERPMTRQEKKDAFLLSKKLQREEAKRLKEQGQTMSQEQKQELVQRSKDDIIKIRKKLVGQKYSDHLDNQINNVALKVFELETGIELPRIVEQYEKDIEHSKKIGTGVMSGVKHTIYDIGSMLGSMFDASTAIGQQSNMIRKDRKYTGSHLGSWEAMINGDEPVDELDRLAMKHDFDFLLASTISDKEKRHKAIHDAHTHMIEGMDMLLKRLDSSGERNTDEYKDVKTALKAIGVMRQADDSAQNVGIDLNSFLVTKGAKMSDPSTSAQVADDVAGGMVHIIDEVTHQFGPYVPKTPYHRVSENDEKLSGLSYAESVGRKKGQKENIPLPSTNIEPEQEMSNVKSEQSEGSGGGGGDQPTQYKNEIHHQEAIKKVPMTLDSLLTELQKMNSSSKDPNDIYSLKPVTGERNMRPLLVKGDYNGVMNRTKKEEEDNLTFYAKWKNIPQGWGNGNQQALPDQILPFKNNMLRAQWDNETIRFSDNYDGGARTWYHETYKPQMQRQSKIHSKNTNVKWAVPMIRDNQTHQLPTRNGALPAGVGRPIQFARETQNGFDIYTPFQRLNARQTRLFNGDVVDGRRV